MVFYMPGKVEARSDAVVLAVPHADYRALGWAEVACLLKQGRGLVMDVKGLLDAPARPAGIELWRL